MPPGPDILSARDEILEGGRFERHGVLDSALEHYQSAERGTRDAATISEALRRQSSVHRTRCEWALAESCAERAMHAARDARLDDLHAEAISALAAVHQSRGNLDAADDLLETGLRLAHDERVRGIVLQNLGGVAAQRGDLETAQRRFVESYGCFRRAGYRRGEAFALNNYGRVLLESGQRAQASRVLDQAVAVARDVEDEDLVALATLNVAETLFLFGDLGAAEAHVSAALGYFNHTQNAWRQIECLRLLGDITAKAQELATAVQCYVRGMQLALRIGARQEMTVLADCLTKVRLSLG
ncbi:MAG: tetratricopeptide repeat protein [Gemmatimonadaceae bacterium]